MITLKDLLLEGKGCTGCTKPKSPLLTENTNPSILSEHVLYHVYNKLPITENIFRYGSQSFLDLWDEVRHLHNTNQIILEGVDKELIEETDLGRFGVYEGNIVPLDLLLEYESEEDLIADEPLSEKTNKKKQPALGKPHRGGSKKFYVYVKDPKTKRIKKVSFGMAGGGLRAKLNNSKARSAFSKRHNCPQKKDRTKASYWSCRLPRYAKLLGFKTTFSGYW